MAVSAPPTPTPPAHSRRRVALGLLAAAVALGGGLWIDNHWPAAPLPPLTPAQAELARTLHDDVVALATTIGERNVLQRQALDTCADWLERDFKRDGYAVERQPFPVAGGSQDNVIASLPGAAGREVVVVGAHYDTVMGAPGANDNGSGVAAVRAIAHALAHRRFARKLCFVGFSNEEYGFQTDQMGSLNYARRCRQRGDQITAMLCLETLGYYSHAPGSQRYPLPILGLLYPDRGDFLAVVGNLPSAGLAHQVAGLFRSRSPFPLAWTALPEQVPGATWSDHWSFWREGYPAVMVTDTAPFRYDPYHTPADTPEKLNYPAFARVVEALTGVVADAGGRLIVEVLDLGAPGVVDAVLALQQRAYRVESALLGVEDLPPLLETAAELLACGETLVAARLETGGLAGVLGYTAAGGEVEIARLMVDPACFRRGVASRLLAALEATPWGVMRVTTGSGNAPALALYRGRGFVPIATRPVRPGLRLITLERRA